MTAVVEYDGVPVGTSVRLGRPGDRARLRGRRTSSAGRAGLRLALAQAATGGSSGATSTRSCAREVLADIAAIMAKARVSDARQRPPAEDLHADELARLAAHDGDAPRPPGWRLTPARGRRVRPRRRAARDRAEVRRRPLARRALRGHARHQPRPDADRRAGHGQALLCELLAAAVSGDSTLTIQGSAATTEDQIKYSWNYALLLAEGPRERSLVPAPLLLGHARGADRALRGDHPLPARGAGLAAVGALRPRAGRPGARRAARGLRRATASTSSPRPTRATAASTR